MSLLSINGYIFNVIKEIRHEYGGVIITNAPTDESYNFAKRWFSLMETRAYSFDFDIQSEDKEEYAEFSDTSKYRQGLTFVKSNGILDGKEIIGLWPYKIEYNPDNGLSMIHFQFDTIK